MSNVISLEAVCPKCDEHFNPIDERDLEHVARTDGELCGGVGTLLGAVLGPVTTDPPDGYRWATDDEQATVEDTDGVWLGIQFPGAQMEMRQFVTSQGLISEQEWAALPLVDLGGS